MTALIVQPKKGKSIILRNGIEILIEEDRAENLQNVLDRIKEHKFIRIDGRSINTADLVGVFELGDNLKKIK